MFSWYKCLIVGLVFSHLGFWSGNLFLIAPFPDLCLLVPFFFRIIHYVHDTLIFIIYSNSSKPLGFMLYDRQHVIWLVFRRKI